MDKRCEHFLFRKFSGPPAPATTPTKRSDMFYPDTASLEKRIEKVISDAMSVDRLLRPRSLRPQVRPSFSGNRSGCLCKHAGPNLRAQLKSPKLSSWKDSSPSKSTANNQKCSESSSRSLSPCPRSYSNPCITSVYASHLSASRSGVEARVARSQRVSGIRYFNTVILEIFVLIKAINFRIVRKFLEFMKINSLLSQIRRSIALRLPFDHISYSFRNPLTQSLPSCRTSRRLKPFLPSSVALFKARGW